MSTSSSDLLDVDQYERRPSHHRSRSGGYIDHLEEKTKLDRRDRERQMKCYHDGHREVSSSQQSTASNRLAVPVFETTRRGRSSSEVGARDRDAGRKYNVQEIRPSPKPRTDYTLSSEPALPSQLPVKYKRKPQHQKRPSIKVEIHQDTPTSSTIRSATPKRSPSASPHSPTAQPQLQYQYAILQNKLSQVGNACAPYMKVEASDPEDLTFGKIAELGSSYAFDLQVWAHVANLEGMARIDPRKKKVVDAASHSLDRLIDRVTELNDACLQAKPRDLKFDVLPQVDDDKLFNDEYDNRYVKPNIMDSRVTNAWKGRERSNRSPELHHPFQPPQHRAANPESQAAQSNITGNDTRRKGRGGSCCEACSRDREVLRIAGSARSLFHRR
jgi:hypothetical protein